MIFQNRTSLVTERLEEMFQMSIGHWPTDGLDIRIRYSRGADFSGTCFYEHDRLHVNLGAHLKYPYQMQTYIARASTTQSAWWKPLYAIELADGYRVVLFVLLHEYYHWLVKRAGRNTRRKEAMCDRYAARALVDQFNAVVRCPEGRAVQRSSWDFQDLDRFVARALTTQRRRISRKTLSPVPQAGLFAESTRSADARRPN